ncbi:MAG: putative sulfate exporter family transporter [Bacteroidota bacterium]
MQKSSALSVLPWSRIFFFIFAILCFTPYFSSPLALLGGVLIANIWGHPFPGLKSKWVSNMLKISIVGLGLGMNFNEALATTQSGFWLIAGSILFTLVAGLSLARWIGLDRTQGFLISVGTAICGGSAIAAVSPVVKATDQQMSISLGVVFLLNAIALLIFPSIGWYLGISQIEFGTWSAIAIHDTSSVVGAANTYGLEALNIATTLKLSRALWIIPVSLISMFLFRAKGQKIKIPFFIFAFIGATLLSTYFPFSFSEQLVGLSRSILVLTLLFIGLNLSKEKIKSAGLKPLLLGGLLWVLVSVGSLLVILLG